MKHRGGHTSHRKKMESRAGAKEAKRGHRDHKMKQGKNVREGGNLRDGSGRKHHEHLIKSVKNPDKKGGRYSWTDNVDHPMNLKGPNALYGPYK